MSETVSAPAADPAPAAPAADTGWVPVGSIIGEAKPAPEAAADPAAPAAAEPAKPAEPAAPTEPAAPATVEYKDLKLPDGIDAKNPALETFTAEAAKFGLPQDQAEALLASVAPKLAEQLAAPYKAWNTLQEQWIAEIKADPAIGGDKLAVTTQSIAKLLDNPALCDPGLRQAMITTGAGNNPAIVRSFAKLAAVLTEGTHVAGKPPAPAASLAAQMYPSMVQSQTGA